MVLPQLPPEDEIYFVSGNPLPLLTEGLLLFVLMALVTGKHMNVTDIAPVLEFMFSEFNPVSTALLDKLLCLLEPQLLCLKNADDNNRSQNVLSSLIS